VSLIDPYKFESRSRAGCSNSDYHLRKTGCCGGFGVEDDELLDFYFDSTDLSRRVFLVQGVSCPFCGAKNFRRQDVEDPAEIPDNWRWATITKP